MGLKVAAQQLSKQWMKFWFFRESKIYVRWAFEDDTKVGAVKRFEVANVGHVIATVKI
jgi:peptidyl-prolyl cis-trans isomerase D